MQPSLAEATRSQSDDPRPLKGIVIVSAGGLVHGGGIGSVTRLIKSWVGTNRPAVRVDVLDARGERSAGAAWSLLRVPVAVARLLYLRLVHRSNILHVQVSERLSFPRKGLFMVIARALGMRVVVHYHGADLMGSYEAVSPRLKRIMRWMATHADVNIVLGQVWRGFLIDKLGAPEERVVVHYNAGKDLLAPGEPREIDPWKFLIAANLLPRKGISELLQAVKRLSESGSPVSLTLAGGGQVARYRAEARELGIADRCEFTGWIQGEPLHRLFHSHSALVLPSYLEGLPIAIIEALSAKLPVVATPVGSIPEVLEAGTNFLPVQPGSVDDIAEALQRIALEPTLRANLAHHGRALYDARFAVEPYMRRLTSLYDALVLPAATDSRPVSAR